MTEFCAYEDGYYCCEYSGEIAYDGEYAEYEAYFTEYCCEATFYDDYYGEYYDIECCATYGNFDGYDYYDLCCDYGNGFSYCYGDYSDYGWDDSEDSSAWGGETDYYDEYGQWSYYECVCNEECYWDEYWEMYWPPACTGDYTRGYYDCENADELWGDAGCPYNGVCECDSDCDYAYDMEYDDCGCDPAMGEFCNYAYGYGGRCSNCYRMTDVDDCYQSLDGAGAAACAKVCFGVYPNEDYAGGCYYEEGYGDLCFYMEFTGTCPEEQDPCNELYGDPEFCEDGASKLWISAGATMGALAALGISLM